MSISSQNVADGFARLERASLDRPVVEKPGDEDGSRETQGRQAFSSAFPILSTRRSVRSQLSQSRICYLANRLTISQFFQYLPRLRVSA
jgi:hypothetical protein